MATHSPETAHLEDLRHLSEATFFVYDNKETSPGRQTLSRLGRISQIAMIAGINDYLHGSYFPDVHTEVLETTPERDKMETAARTFVNQTVGTLPVGKVYWQPRETSRGYWGVHDALLRLNYMADRDGYASESLRQMHESSTLVHELAHSTGNTNTIVAIRSVEPNDSLKATVSVASVFGMKLPRITKQGGESYMVAGDEGSFFEEAFAEETAARWRVQYSPLLRDHAGQLFNTTDNLQVPARFFDHGEPTSKMAVSTINSHSVYPAYALSLLSRHNGVDFYELMRLMRGAEPAAKAELKKELIRSIDNVEPGLYASLRSLPYGKEGFISGLKRVQSALNKR